jgi:hypothetical protein
VDDYVYSMTTSSALNVAYPLGGLAIGFLGYSWAPAVFLALMLFQWLLVVVADKMIPKNNSDTSGGIGFIHVYYYILSFGPTIAAVATPLILPRANIVDHRILAAYVGLPLMLLHSRSMSTLAPSESRNRTMAILIFIHVVLPLAAYYYFALR